jgi:hypothetical protein
MNIFAKIFPAFLRPLFLFMRKAGMQEFLLVPASPG